MGVRELIEFLVRAAILGAALLPSVSTARAQVYEVAKSTTVVRGPNGNVAAASKTTVVTGGGTATKTTVVAGGSTLPHGYIAVLPGGYHAVTVSGVCTTPWAAFTIARKCTRAARCM
jgi:hypothetical protein